jgi:serine/threonine-protein kinase RsbT
MQDGYSTAGGLGMGLPGSKRLSNEFYVEPTLGKGTKVTLIRWRST